MATAAYQVEGAVKNEGKGPTLWDWNSRQPNGVVDNTTGWDFNRIYAGLTILNLRDCILGDVVDLQYYLYKEDIARVAALGFNAHSFSSVLSCNHDYSSRSHRGVCIQNILGEDIPIRHSRLTCQPGRH